MYCKYLDQDNHEYTHKYIRETAVSRVGKSNIISGTGKWKKYIGNNFMPLIIYKQHFF